MVSNAGSAGKRVLSADLAGEDSFSPTSYWWQFRALNDWVKGDPLYSLPGCYHERNPRVRARFNALEQTFSDQLPEVMRRAVEIREQDPAGMSSILDQFSLDCVRQVVEALQELRAAMPV